MCPFCNQDVNMVFFFFNTVVKYKHNRWSLSTDVMSKLLILPFVLENKIGDFFNILVLETVVSGYVRPFSFFLVYKGTIYQSRAEGWSSPSLLCAALLKHLILGFQYGYRIYICSEHRPERIFSLRSICQEILMHTVQKTQRTNEISWNF